MIMEKCVIDSSGNVITLPQTANNIRLIPVELREKELNKFVEDFSSLLSVRGIDVNGKKYSFMIQPFYTTERLLIFAKTEFSSSSQAVKLSNEIEKHPEIMANKEKTEFLKSIFPDSSSGRTRWYFLTVGYVVFERNLYDCKRINLGYAPPVPYEKFIKSVKGQLLKPEDDEKNGVCYGFKLIENDVPVWDGKDLLPCSFERDITGGKESKFDILIGEAVAEYKRLKGYGNKDRLSNKANLCLSIINDNNRNIFPIYLDVKNCIKKTFKDAFNVQYKGNRITAQLGNGQKLTIYVYGADDRPQFVIGGNVYSGVPKLQEALQSSAAFTETEWFTEKVKPNIKEEVHKCEKRRKYKDEIDWNKNKRKKGKKKNGNNG